MAGIDFSDFYARVQDIAAQEHRAVEDVLSDMLEQYTSDVESNPSDDNIEVPDWIREEDIPRYRQAARRVRKKTYERARRYWSEVGDTKRLALSDEELDQEFWLIDLEGIPRLKSEQGGIEVPHDSLYESAKRAYLESKGSGIENLSERSRELYKEALFREYENRMKDDEE